jgi:hypothetical protein
MLQSLWYIEQPLDFEYKNYILLHYLQEIDHHYKKRELSPYLLWTENLVNELQSFIEGRNQFIKSVTKKELLFKTNGLEIVERGIKDNEDFETIIEIVEYSKPLLESKVNLGWKLFKKYPQVLF